MQRMSAAVQPRIFCVQTRIRRTSRDMMPVVCSASRDMMPAVCSTSRDMMPAVCSHCTLCVVLHFGACD
jgi:hypothetical protein